MDEQLAGLLAQACELEGIEVKVVDNYSGRGMFGKLTTALTGELTLAELPGVILAHAELFVDGDESLFCSQEFSQDNMGRDDHVIY